MHQLSGSPLPAETPVAEFLRSSDPTPSTPRNLTMAPPPLARPQPRPPAYYPQPQPQPHPGREEPAELDAPPEDPDGVRRRGAGVARAPGGAGALHRARPGAVRVFQGVAGGERADRRRRACVRSCSFSPSLSPRFSSPPPSTCDQAQEPAHEVSKSWFPCSV